LFEFRAEDQGAVIDPLRLQVEGEGKNGWEIVIDEKIVS